ncbi:uncharacterized protein LOC128555442 [Mercenaria mercenaria]|uniref:uncharacterized protein LOC128555442 n=1 Tax=Mercenaria mercenaria TaxID=6596 RepID=UPI00234E6E97|nr:uncharacterized protein LOC128555442 [Mercenaria mercenaria]
MSVHYLVLLVYGAVLCFLQSDAAKKYGYVFAPRFISPGTNYVVTVDLYNFLEIKSGMYDVQTELKIYSYATRTYTDVVAETESFSDYNPRGDIILQVRTFV